MQNSRLPTIATLLILVWIPCAARGQDDCSQRRCKVELVGNVYVLYEDCTPCFCPMPMPGLNPNLQCSNPISFNEANRSKKGPSDTGVVDDFTHVCFLSIERKRGATWSTFSAMYFPVDEGTMAETAAKWFALIPRASGSPQQGPQTRIDIIFHNEAGYNPVEDFEADGDIPDAAESHNFRFKFEFFDGTQATTKIENGNKKVVEAKYGKWEFIIKNDIQ